jgi:heme oxygenase
MVMSISVQIGENCLNIENAPGVVEGRSAGTVRALLRRSTADQHAELDAKVSALLSGHEADYILFLHASAAALVPLENALEAAGVASILPDWDARTRRRALICDLADFGGAAQTTLCIPAIETEAFCFGVLYVLEGSRLGATLLARRISERPDHRVRTAMRYLNHGAGQRLWPTFLKRLERAQSVRNAPHDAISGARSAFAIFSLAYSKTSQA